MIDKYDKGDVLRTVATFVSHAGSAAVPSMVYFRFKNPNGDVATYEFGSGSIIALASNSFAVEHPLNVSGDWACRVEGVGINASAEEFSIHVRPSRF
jgi:hypothetical protein